MITLKKSGADREFSTALKTALGRPNRMSGGSGFDFASAKRVRVH
jgi:hypothetical protein